MLRLRPIDGCCMPMSICMPMPMPMPMPCIGTPWPMGMPICMPICGAICCCCCIGCCPFTIAKLGRAGIAIHLESPAKQTDQSTEAAKFDFLRGGGLSKNWTSFGEEAFECMRKGLKPWVEHGAIWETSCTPSAMLLAPSTPKSCCARNAHLGVAEG